jgi:glycogen debranching enzyme
MVRQRALNPCIAGSNPATRVALPGRTIDSIIEGLILRSSMESPIKLFPGETIVSYEKLDLKTPATMPNAVSELCKLTGVSKEEEIGSNGPSIASRASEVNSGEDHLRLFEVVFGRDSLIVSLIVADLYPLLLESTVLFLASYVGTGFNLYCEEEPGRIPHEIRDPETDPVARKLTQTSGWQWPYYGSIDATALFLIAAGRVIKNKPHLLNQSILSELDGKSRTLKEIIQMSRDWIISHIDEEGFFWWKHSFPGAHKVQVWKDSFDSYSYSDGEIADHDNKLASIETQMLAYKALVASEGLLFDEVNDVIELIRVATEKLWLPEKGFYGSGAEKKSSGWKVFDIKTSNAGWLLGCDLIPQERVDGMVKLFSSPEFQNDSGIRTLSAKEYRYRPTAYHNGNVWLFDSYIISSGFRLRGYLEEAKTIERKIEACTEKFHRLPEYVSGDEEAIIADNIIDLFDANLNQDNRVAQPPQEIQAWSVASLVAIKAINQGKAISYPFA